jgi:hypothetical protein
MRSMSTLLLQCRELAPARDQPASDTDWRQVASCRFSRIGGRVYVVTAGLSRDGLARVPVAAKVVQIPLCNLNNRIEVAPPLQGRLEESGGLPCFVEW